MTNQTEMKKQRRLIMLTYAVGRVKGISLWNSKKTKVGRIPSTVDFVFLNDCGVGVFGSICY